MLVWVVETKIDADPLDVYALSDRHGEGICQYLVFKSRDEARQWVRENDDIAVTRIRRYRLVPVKGKKG